MPQFESLTNSSEFLSDHFFTTDDTKASFLKEVHTLRKAWKEADDAGEPNTHRRFSSVRQKLVTELANLTEDAPPERIAPVYATLREALGYPGELSALRTERSGTPLTLEGIWAEPTETETSDLIWLSATPADTVEDALTSSTPLGEIYEGEKLTQPTLGSLISDVFLTEEAPQYIAAMAGRFLILAERERWPEGRFLAADVLLVTERNQVTRGGEVDYFLAIFGRDSLRPAADGSIWWDRVLEESVAHSVSVSKDLREGVRRSIEIIANDVLDRRRAQGLPAGDIDGKELGRQSLRYLYRILFLLYAEASPELQVLPVGAQEYDTGYGLDRLRELISQDLTTESSRRGTHFYESLQLLFELVNGSHPSQQVPRPASAETTDSPTLDFQPLEADLFNPERTALIDHSKLSNEALHDVLTRLLLSSEKWGTQRGFVSYANLGINQLGAVYEGLMSYTGFIADEDFHEVAPEGNAEKGSWVVPTTRSESIEPRHFVQREDGTGGSQAVVHRRGSFVFRLAGRERQQSASYYTPEVLTRFVVSQALEELLDQPDEDGHPQTTTASEILQLTICEPALGSGAFAIEAVRQLAGEYLTRRQAELGEQIPAEDFAVELQKVKAQIALHQVHGVDLNSTAVELAEVSLWLDTMNAGLQAPWFGLRLKRGNSLVGARRAVYTASAARAGHYAGKSAVESTPLPLSGMAESMERDESDPAAAGAIHHFLLPGEGWGAAADAKEIKALAGANQKVLKEWQKAIKRKLTKDQVSRLQGLAQRVGSLWPIALRRLQIAEAEARRDIDYYGRGTPHHGVPAVTRAEIERKLQDPDGVFQRLKRVMDAWGALWFWPVLPDDAEQPLPPTLDEWIAALEGILGTTGGRLAPKYRSEGQLSVLSSASWADLDHAEDLEKQFFIMRPIASLVEWHPWLAVCERIADEQGFFHWELEFATVFAKGGFDLQVGNPPWVRPRSDLDALLAEHDPWWQLAAKPTQAQRKSREAETLALPGAREEFVAGAVQAPLLSEWLSAPTQYATLKGLQPDLYRAFMVRTWRSSKDAGRIALIHPESHFTEKKAARLREETYRRLRRHWQFINSLFLFEIHDQVVYGVHVYGQRSEEPGFIMAASLYHPDTAERSLHHDGGSEVPGLKTSEGAWDVRPHRERILHVDHHVLSSWSKILEEPGTPPLQSRMVYPVNHASQSVLEKLSQARRVRDLELQYSSGWHETADRKKGYFEVGSAVNASWDQVILQGPHFSVANPFYKEPRPTMKHNQDYEEIDLEALPEYLHPLDHQRPENLRPVTLPPRLAPNGCDYRRPDLLSHRYSTRGRPRQRRHLRLWSSL
ncbi:Eco57I restriction-modification methylase domain-containing protein [Nesterenkonia sphaerica]|uniref:Eco57I restriction-modification methylase domain-containing protein n=1 Tax=Nesterenkonia sphaerica TaxID=1804988 RepID=UPI001AA02A8E|nr:DNA methyltransferase [Nesterenkonia sphaerica]